MTTSEDMPSETSMYITIMVVIIILVRIEVKHLRDKCQRMLDEFNSHVGIQRRGGAGSV